MRDDEFLKEWNEFGKLGYDPQKLTDKKLDEFTCFLAVKVFPQLKNEARFYQFVMERNNRNADKVAKTGLLLASAAVILAIVQIYLVLRN